MTEEIYDYDVRCRTCYKKFTVQLFESHEKNLWLVGNKDWYCKTCKTEYLEKQTAKLADANAEKGFPALTGTPKRISWAEKIRAELINKVNYLRESLVFNDDKERAVSDQAFHLFFQQWQEKTDAKWWIDNRKTTVRDISDNIKKITDSLDE